ncbi:MAG: tRNA dihydrouridine(20/20a) synthase DusA, partial [Deltaproteobacteria bacterium CG_4_10_14_0_2_um_filter_43_8]
PMITAQALFYGYAERLIDYSAEEHPLALQVGGSDTKQLAHAAKEAEKLGYREVNLNVGCPSDRVQSGKMGACLMAEPELVAECVKAMQDACSLPITVKHRIGIDEQDAYLDMHAFVDCVSKTGCTDFIVHARKAWLKGLSPKENRTKPPIRHEDVHKLKQDFPHLHIVINGEIRKLDQAKTQLEHVDGVMIGRAAYEDMFIFAEADELFFGAEKSKVSREEVVEKSLHYLEAEMKKGVKPKSVLGHLSSLYQGQTGAKAWRRSLSSISNSHSFKEICSILRSKEPKT